MQTEFDFYGNEPARPARPERLFFCLSPDSETSIRTEQLGQQFLRDNQLKGKLLRTERFHVSLHLVGDYKRLRTKFIYAAQLAARAISMPSFEVTFRSIESFEGAPLAKGHPRKRPLVLLGESDALFELHKLLGDAMKKFGLRASDDFKPHMTLSYGPESVPLQAIEPIRFVVSDFFLVHSELWLTRYNMIDRLSLQG